MHFVGIGTYGAHKLEGGGRGVKLERRSEGGIPYQFIINYLGLTLASTCMQRYGTHKLSGGGVGEARS